MSTLARTRPAEDKAAAARVRLELRGVSVSARGKCLLEDIYLSLQDGDFIALLGPNGAGKTTLLRAALGHVPCSGEVTLDGQVIRDLSGRRRAARVAWLPQHTHAIEPITALAWVEAARYRFAEPAGIAERAALQAMRRTRSDQLAPRLVTELSGGEQQRVALAALVAQEAPLLCLDEPANHLDPAQQVELYRLLGELWRAGHGILCITHDVNMLRHVGGEAKDIRVVGLAEGRIRFEHPLTAPQLPQALGDLFQLEFQALERDGQRFFLPGTLR
jgi:iron complex transport system ATP-binding protein